ncbi:hypothetical protein C7N43_14935 [Sphingobacteriales bacterium UPWRP_1]|nr:hypothetical protein C7N43_14935 [Sphingobacteriales bacterium UPWRP_1]
MLDERLLVLKYHFFQKTATLNGCCFFLLQNTYRLFLWKKTTYYKQLLTKFLRVKQFYYFCNN